MMGPLTAMKCPSSEPVSTIIPSALSWTGCRPPDCPARGWRWPAGAAQVDLVVAIHAYELKDLLPTGDEARAEHVVDAEGLARRGGRRGGAVHNVRELLLQLQIVQNEAVAVVGYAEAVRGLAVGGSSEAASREPV